MIIKDPIGNRVREIRLRLGIQQQQLAHEVGVSRQTIIGIEKGRLENPTIRVCLKIARILREPVDYVFYLDRHSLPGNPEEIAAQDKVRKVVSGSEESTISPNSSEGSPIPVPSEGIKVPEPQLTTAGLSSRTSLEQALPAFLRNLRTNQTAQQVDSAEVPDVTYPLQGNGHEPGDNTNGSM